MKNLRGIIVIVVCACLCVGYYYYLSHRDTAKDSAPTEMEQLINKDLDKSYPTTPREVIKFYNRILCSLYNEESSEEEVEALGEQARKLFDEELLAQNPEDVYFTSLETELEEYAEDKKKIISVTISTSKEVDYKEANGEECAYVESSYYLKGENETGRAEQTYILRKDENGRWKILGYYRP